MTDGVLAWAKRQRTDWVREIKLLEAGVFTMFEIKDGKKVDTTSERLADTRSRLSELEMLIDRHESAADK